MEQPTENNSIYIPYDNGFIKAASIMGFASIVTTFFGLITVPMILGGMAVILALLSRGKGDMKVLHTSDWHLGATDGGRLLRDDQIHFINEICEIIEAEGVGAVLIAAGGEQNEDTL